MKRVTKIYAFVFLISVFISNNSHAQLGGFLDRLKKEIESIVVEPKSGSSGDSTPFSSMTNDNSAINFNDLGQIEQLIQEKTKKLSSNKDFCDYQNAQRKNLCLGMDLKEYIKITNSVLFAPHSIINDPTIQLGSGQILCDNNDCVRNFGEKTRTVTIVAKDGVGQPTISALARGGVEGTAIDRSNKSRSCVGKGCEELLKQTNKPQRGNQVTIEAKQSNVCHMTLPRIYLQPSNNPRNTYKFEEVYNDQFDVYKFNIIDCSYGEIWNGFKVVKKYRFFANKLIGISTELYNYESEYDRIEENKFMSILNDETKKTYGPYMEAFKDNQIFNAAFKNKPNTTPNPKMVMLDTYLQSIANGIRSKYYIGQRPSPGERTIPAGGNFIGSFE